jgi:NADH:ubiquinone oxidoreductase subunit 3 (subunit A)
MKYIIAFILIGVLVIILLSGFIYGWHEGVGIALIVYVVVGAAVWLINKAVIKNRMK